MARLNVNGTVLDLDVTDDMPLLWALRDLAGIKGPKFGCGVAACGACTVLVDGVATRSCSVAAADLEGSEIVTIDGLSANGSLHPVQQAWLDIQVAQCGYCQSGQIMNAVALLQDNPDPSDADIDEAMAGNLCRCGTYEGIRAAIKQAAKAMPKQTSAET